MNLHHLANLLTVPLSILATVRGDSNSDPSAHSMSEKFAANMHALLQSQNRSIDPCTDFAAYACNVSQAPYLPSVLQEDESIARALENVKSSDVEAVKKAAKFFNACMDVDAIKRRGLEPIARSLSDYGELLVCDTSNNEYFTWQRIHEYFAKHFTISTLFDIDIDADQSNPSRHILSLGGQTVQVEQFINGDLYIDESVYKNFVIAVVEELKTLRRFDVKYDNLLANVDNVLRFRDELSEIYESIYNNNSTDDPQITTVETLQKDWDAVVQRTPNYSINWLDVINNRFEGTDIVIKASEKIALLPAAFVANFSRVLIHTPIQTIVDYIHWKVIENLMSGTISQSLSSHKDFEHYDYPRFLICLSEIRVDHVSTYIYVKNIMDVRTKPAILEMIENMKDELKLEISATSWLDEATKSVIRKKVDAMRLFEEYPKWYDEDGKIDEYYRELSVGSHHFENFLAYRKFTAKKRMSTFRNPVDETDNNIKQIRFDTYGLASLRWTGLSYDLANWQWPYFDHESPSVINYAGIGSSFAQTMAIGFDPIGIHYDEAGLKRKLWSQSAIDMYKTKTRCFIEQFKNHTLHWDNTTIIINGTEKQDVTLADGIAYRVTLRAYERLRNAGKINEPTIQLLKNFTDAQLFFLHVGYSFCRPNRTGVEDVTNHFLVLNGTLSNLKEFADAFNCPLGSPMNPSKKCSMWD